MNTTMIRIPSGATFFAVIAGYAVFPSIGKGGAFVGGAYNKQNVGRNAGQSGEVSSCRSDLL